jgi:1-acyl-sn-glycerol-3-phosphate acyltransferase
VARATAFYAGLVLSLLGYVFLVVPVAAFLPFTRRYRLLTSWGDFVIWWCERTCRLRHEVRFEAPLPERAAIVMANHQSAWETMALQRYFPPMVWVLKRELLRIPFFGWGLALIEPIAIDRGAGRRAVEQLVEQGRERLRAGRWIIVFPEGTRVAPGRRRSFKLGGAILAARTGAPVVPVAHNAGLYWRRREFIKRPGTIRIVVGAPIATEGRSPEEIHAEVEAWILARRAELEPGFDPSG